jgi:DNA polymerase-3 subunit beta
MKFYVQQDVFRSVLMSVYRAVPSKSTLPVLSNFLFEAKDGNVQVSATNLELSISLTMPAKVDEAGSICIPAKLLLDLVNNLPPKMIYIEVSDVSAIVTCEKSKSTLTTMPASDYPDVPTITDAPSHQIGNIVRLMSKVASAAAYDDSRPVLTAVNMQLGDDAMIVAADGFRLAKNSLPAWNGEPINLLIPATTINEATRVFADDDEISMQIAENQNSITLFTKTKCMVSRLIDGKFPDVGRVIPTNHESLFSFEIADFQKAVKIASLMNPGGAVRLDIGNESTMLVYSGSQQGTGSSRIDGMHSGTHHEVAVNGKFLQDALSTLASISTHAILHSSNANAPILFRPQGNDTFLYIIMPIAVR